MPYVPDPTDITRPTDADPAESAQLEFRAFKAYVASLAGLTGGMNLFRKNAIIGGCFDTNPWQRGTNFVGTATTAYTADRWTYVKTAGTLVIDTTKTADAPTAVAAGLLINNCLQLNATTAEAAIGAAEISVTQQYIEGYNFAAQLAARIMTLSFWHKHTKAGTYCVAFGNSGADRSYVAEYTQAVADTWEFSQVTVPASPAAGTWDYTTGIGLRVSFTQFAGVNFQTATGAWAVGNFYATANQVNAFDTIGNKFRIANVQLEAGSAASPFETRNLQQELQLCQRYYEKSFVPATTPAQNAGVDTGEAQFIAGKAGATNNQIPIRFVTPMRVAPTVVTFNPAAANAQVRNETAGADHTAVGTAISSVAMRIGSTGNAGGAVGDLIGVHWTADAEL